MSEIRPDFLEFNANGLYCKYGDFYVDPQKPAGKAVISHAHADHAISGNHEIWATEATIAFMKLRYTRYTARTAHAVGFGQPFTIGEVKITLIPAGHMLG